MKIVIIGAGISGLAAYLSLKKHLPQPAAPASDHIYTIYEAYDTNKDSTSEQRWSSLPPGETIHSSTLIIGGGLGLGPNGVKVVQRLDSAILRDIVSNGYVLSKYKMRFRNGSLLMTLDGSAAASLDANNQDRSSDVVYTVGTSRHSLWRSLRTRVPDEIIVNKRVSEVVASSDDHGKVLVRFADCSEPVKADLVIGADGLKSITRNALFPNVNGDAYRPQYEGLVGIGGFIPLTPDLRQKVGKGTMTFFFGGNGFFGYFPSASSPDSPNRDSATHISEPGDQLGWWSTYAMEESPKDPRNVNSQEILGELRQRYKHWTDPVVRQIIGNRDLEIKHIYPTWTAPEIPSWERNGVVLVGDAAHALPTTLGQGSSQALEDVETFTLLLAHELRNAYKSPLQSQAVTERNAVTTAAGEYVALRRPHLKEILARAKQMQNSKRNMSVIQEYSMYLVMWIMGWFPSVASKPFREVAEYNIKEEIEKFLDGKKS